MFALVNNLATDTAMITNRQSKASHNFCLWPLSYIKFSTSAPLNKWIVKSILQIQMNFMLKLKGFHFKSILTRPLYSFVFADIDLRLFNREKDHAKQTIFLNRHN